MYFTFFDISALSYNFFRIAPGLILLGSCRVTKKTRNGPVWQLTLYLTEGPSAGSRPQDKREARSSRPLDKGKGGGGRGGVGSPKFFFPPFCPPTSSRRIAPYPPSLNDGNRRRRESKRPGQEPKVLTYLHVI